MLDRLGRYNTVLVLTVLTAAVPLVLWLPAGSDAFAILFVLLFGFLSAGFVAVNARAFAVAQANRAPRFYWDWVRRRSAISYLKFCGTAPQNLLMGMEAAFELLFHEGLDAVFTRHAQLAGAVHAAVQAWSKAGALGFFAQDPACRSVSVTTVMVPEGTDVDALRRVARERFQVAMAGALGPLTGRGFRIAHLGDSNAAVTLGAIAGIEAALRVQGIPVGDGGTQRAVAALASQEQTP